MTDSASSTSSMPALFSSLPNLFHKNHNSPLQPLDCPAPSAAVAAAAAATARDENALPNTYSVTPERLACLIQEKVEDLLMLDLRSFMSFNQCHLPSSINVCIPTAIQKRKNFSLSAVESSIGCDKSRERFKRRQGSDIIVYDSDCEKVKKNGLLSTLLQKFKDESVVTGVYFLQGGFQNFAQKFPQFCSSKDTLSSSLNSSLTGSLPNPYASLTRSIPLLLTPNNEGAAAPEASDKEPVEIFDYLYVGGEAVSSNLETLQKYKLTYILNAAKEVPDCFTDNPTLNYLRLDLLDCATQDLDFAIFERAFSFIDEARAKGQRVLVHCKAGQSRSATIVISYIIHSQRWNLGQAYKFVQGKRPAVSPNLGFIAQLIRFETSVLGTSTAIHQLISSCSSSSLPIAASSSSTPSSSSSSASSTSVPASTSAAQSHSAQPLPLSPFERNPALVPIGCK